MINRLPIPKLCTPSSSLGVGGCYSRFCCCICGRGLIETNAGGSDENNARKQCFAILQPLLMDHEWIFLFEEKVFFCSHILIFVFLINLQTLKSVTPS